LRFHYENGCDRLSDSWKHRKSTNRGHQFGVPAWNKGLTKDCDLRVAKNSASLAVTLRQQFADGIRHLWKVK
jgi:hypothetical protein